MKQFVTFESIVCPLDMSNVDTDQIIPKQFLKRVERSGFGEFLFYDWRYKTPEKLNEEFILNHPNYKNAHILLTRDNFGCGSSREHAPWALLDYGFRCIIAPSFADIFYTNCFQNGILLIELPSNIIDTLFTSVLANPSAKIKVNLANKTLFYNNKDYTFNLSDELQEKLLKGLDDISITIQYGEAISSYEKSHTIFS